jgi:hypothetical protein
MSDTNVPQLPRSGFPQAYDGQLFHSLFGIVKQAFAASTCCYETPESSWGACDGGFPCPELALPGSEFCERHQ